MSWLPLVPPTVAFVLALIASLVGRSVTEELMMVLAVFGSNPKHDRLPFLSALGKAEDDVEGAHDSPETKDPPLFKVAGVVLTLPPVPLWIAHVLLC